MKDNLSITFNTDGNIIKPAINTTIMVPLEDNSFDSDCEIVRSNIYDLLDKGKDVLETAIDIAAASENPKMFEQVSSIMKNLGDLNHQLIDVHNKRIKKSDVNDKPTNITNNTAVFYGTTAELNKIINGR